MLAVPSMFPNTHKRFSYFEIRSTYVMLFNVSLGLVIYSYSILDIRPTITIHTISFYVFV